MSALLGHSDAARCLAAAFASEQANQQMKRDKGWEERALMLDAMSQAYEYAAVLMLEENKRQIGATPHSDPNAV